MRKVILALLVSLLWLNVGGSLTLADGMILPEALSPDYLIVRYHRVTVSIEDNHAVTRVDQEFYNPHPFPVEGRYLFPLPPEAILSRFQATVDGQPQQVDRQDPATTNAALYPIVTQRRDPSLLQYADWESLAFDLSLPPGGSRQMNLEYEEVLVPAGGLYRYHYLLSTERYSSQPLEEVSLTVNLHSASGLSSLYSSTHPVTVERPGPGQARVSWEARDIRPSDDFDLFFAPAEGGVEVACSPASAAVTTTSCSSFRRRSNRVKAAPCPKTSCSSSTARAAWAARRSNRRETPCNSSSANSVKRTVSPSSVLTSNCQSWLTLCSRWKNAPWPTLGAT